MCWSAEKAEDCVKDLLDLFFNMTSGKLFINTFLVWQFYLQKEIVISTVTNLYEILVKLFSVQFVLNCI